MNKDIDKNMDTGGEDELLRNLIKKDLPYAPPSPWFTKKVLNKLPERRRRIASYCEYAVYLLALGAVTAYGIKLFKAVMSAPVITVSDITVGITVAGIFTALIWSIISPFANSGKSIAVRGGKL